MECGLQNGYWMSPSLVLYYATGDRRRFPCAAVRLAGTEISHCVPRMQPTGISMKTSNYLPAPLDPIFAGRRGGNNARGYRVKLTGCCRLFATAVVAASGPLWLFNHGHLRRTCRQRTAVPIMPTYTLRPRTCTESHPMQTPDQSADRAELHFWKSNCASNRTSRFAETTVRQNRFLPVPTPPGRDYRSPPAAGTRPIK